jgi:hypothetical protein
MFTSFTLVWIISAPRHPYNPLKYFMHAYAGSPTGYVILTRTTILALSGWSNTQFSYWARRVEAVSVLEACDERIRAIASALKRHLFCNGSHHQPQLSSTSVDPRPEKDLYLDITGKGLDTVIEEVKKQTGKSPFLRGRHCSLDPFGSPPDREGQSDIVAAARVFNASFQAVAYTHTPAIPSDPPTGAKLRRNATKKKMEPWRYGGHPMPTGVDIVEPYTPLTFAVSDSGEISPEDDCWDRQKSTGPYAVSLPRFSIVGKPFKRAPTLQIYPSESSVIGCSGGLEEIFFLEDLTSNHVLEIGEVELMQTPILPSTRLRHSRLRSLPVSDSQSEVQHFGRKRVRDDAEAPTRRKRR